MRIAIVFMIAAAALGCSTSTNGTYVRAHPCTYKGHYGGVLSGSVSDGRYHKAEHSLSEPFTEWSCRNLDVVVYVYDDDLNVPPIPKESK